MSLTDRILDLAGGDDPRFHESKLRAFQIVLLMAVSTEALLDSVQAYRLNQPMAPWLLVGGLLLAGCLGPVVLRRWTRLATAGAALVMAYIYALRFPGTANHHFLALLCMGLLASFDATRDEERDLLLKGLRWVTVIVFFYSGLQKAWYGLYFQGEYFAYFIASKTRFVDFFRYVLPAHELARIQDLGPAAAGSGPYRVHWLPFVALTNAVVLGEMILPVLLLVRRTRWIALAGSMMLIVAIEFGAREFIFGAMFAGLLLLFAERDPNRRLLPAFAALFVLLLILRLLVPELEFA